MPRSKHIINIHTATGTTAPTNASLVLGEIAVQHTPNDPALWIKMGTSESSTTYAKFVGESAITSAISSAWSAINTLSAATPSTANCLTGVTLNGSAMTVSNHVAQIVHHELPEVTSSDDGKVLKVVDSVWCAATTTIIYGGTDTPPSSLGNDGDVYLQSSPVVVYETDGTTGLLGHNNSSFANYWQLENLDLTPYKYIKCYFKAASTADSSTYTPAVVVTVPLDAASMGPTAYMGGVMVALPFNRNRQYMVSCAVDSTKTKFQVIHQNTFWDISTSDANSDGRYCYKIEGYF